MSVVEPILLFCAGIVAGGMLARSIIAARRRREREDREWDARIQRFLRSEEAREERERSALAKEIVDELERRDP